LRSLELLRKSGSIVELMPFFIFLFWNFYNKMNEMKRKNDVKGTYHFRS